MASLSAIEPQQGPGAEYGSGTVPGWISGVFNLAAASSDWVTDETVVDAPTTGASPTGIGQTTNQETVWVAPGVGIVWDPAYDELLATYASPANMEPLAYQGQEQEQTPPSSRKSSGDKDTSPAHLAGWIYLGPVQEHAPVVGINDLAFPGQPQPAFLPADIDVSTYQRGAEQQTSPLKEPATPLAPVAPTPSGHLGLRSSPVPETAHARRDQQRRRAEIEARPANRQGPQLGYNQAIRFHKRHCVDHSLAPEAQVCAPTCQLQVDFPAKYVALEKMMAVMRMAADGSSMVPVRHVGSDQPRQVKKLFNLDKYWTKLEADAIVPE